MSITSKAIIVALFAGTALSPMAGMAQEASGQTGAGAKIIPQAEQQQTPSAKGGASAQTETKSGSAGADVKANAQAAPLKKPDQSASQAAGKEPSATQAQSEPMKKPEGGASSSAKAEDAKPADGKNTASSTKKEDTNQTAQDSNKTSRDSSDTARSSTTVESERNTATDTQRRNGTEAASSNRTSNEVTGSVNVNITTEQRTEVRNVIVETKVETIKPTFTVSIGTAVPRTVKLHKLPPRVVKIVPAYANYDYIVLADERIVIIDPTSYEIVYILTI